MVTTQSNPGGQDTATTPPTTPSSRRSRRRWWTALIVEILFGIAILTGIGIWKYTVEGSPASVGYAQAPAAAPQTPASVAPENDASNTQGPCPVNAVTNGPDLRNAIQVMLGNLQQCWAAGNTSGIGQYVKATDSNAYDFSQPFPLGDGTINVVDACWIGPFNPLVVGYDYRMGDNGQLMHTDVSLDTTGIRPVFLSLPRAGNPAIAPTCTN